MKKASLKFALSIFATFLIFCLSAQDFNGGIIGGITTSQIDNDKLAGYNKFGVNAGIFVERDFTEKIAAQFELKFTQKGASEPDLEYKKRLDYVELGFLAKYDLKYLDIEAGLNPGILIKEKNTYMDVEYDDPTFKTFDVPISIGAYYHLTDNLAFNARFSYSLLLMEGYLNNVLSFSLYYSIK